MPDGSRRQAGARLEMGGAERQAAMGDITENTERRCFRDVKITGIPLVNANPNVPNQANTEIRIMTDAQNRGGDLHVRR